MGHAKETGSPDSQFEYAERAAQFILGQTTIRPKIALVLGSGLGSFADELTKATRVPYQDIPGYPQATAEGHAGMLVIATVGAVPVAIMQGRVHLYEGLTPQEVAFPMRVFGRMGIKAAILTNAAGGISDRLKPGCLVVLNDHINLQGINPLTGPNDPRFGPRFVDLTTAYNKGYGQMALREGERLNLSISTGVYAALPGPNYETPAEIRFLRTIGADVVGMSLVSEAIAARHMGIEILAISCVTNMAAGITGAAITHDEVLEAGERVRQEFIALLNAVIPCVSDDLIKTGGQ